MRDLFSIFDGDLDDVYVNIRDAKSGYGLVLKEYCQGLWSRFNHLADDHFASEFARHFDERFWEMYLGCTLLDLGLNPRAHPDGPDFSFSFAGRTYWIEAVCPGPGERERPDSVPEMKLDGGEPVNQIVLRYANALTEKRNKFFEYYDKNLISKEDGCIVAVSGGRLLREYPFDRSNCTYIDYLYIVRALLPIGAPYLSISSTDPDYREPGITHEPTITKANGAPVNKLVFVDPEWSWLTSVLYDPGGLSGPSLDHQPGSNFHHFHNPNAAVRIPLDTLPVGRAFWFEGDRTKTKDFRQAG